MIIHLTGSARRMGEDLPYLQAMIQVIHEHGHVLARNWVDPAHSRIRQGIKDEEVDWKRIVNENLESITRADLVIIEISNYHLSQGFQLATALQQKKPTLVVTRDTQFKGRFASGIDSDLLRVKEYHSEQELQAIVEEFLKNNTITSKDLRFNFFIDRQIYNYLRWAAGRSGKTKSEILRSIVEREIDKEGGL